MGDVSMLGMTLAGVAGFQKYKTASVNYEISEAVRKKNNSEAVSSLMSTYRALDSETDQIAEGGVAVSIDSQKQAAKMKGSVMAQAGASGTGGSGTSMALGDIDDQTAENSARAAMNRDRQLSQMDEKRKGAIATAQSRIDVMPNQKKPSFWAYGLEAGANGFRNVTAIDKFNDTWSQW